MEPAGYGHVLVVEVKPAESYPGSFFCKDCKKKQELQLHINAKDAYPAKTGNISSLLWSINPGK